MSSSMGGVRGASLALLAQKRALLRSIKPEQFTAPCAVVGGGSIGQHLRHALDHYRHCLAAEYSPEVKGTDTFIHYDVRNRGTTVESDIEAARAEIDRLSKQVKDLSEDKLNKPVKAVFILSAEGDEQPFTSTLGRELGFATHHAIHHNAMIKAIVNSHKLPIELPENYGLAPSTANYEKWSSIGGYIDEQ